MGWGRGQQNGWGYRAAEWLGVQGSRMDEDRGQQNGRG